MWIVVSFFPDFMISHVCMMCIYNFCWDLSKKTKNNIRKSVLFRVIKWPFFLVNGAEIPMYTFDFTYNSTDYL